MQSRSTELLVFLPGGNHRPRRGPLVAHFNFWIRYKMANQNPLFSYNNLRPVMTHLDPLVRLQISTHCPSLQNVTSIVPMKIKYLEITRADFKINSTTYSMGIIRKYNNRRNPRIVDGQNALGGYQFDTDQYGIRRNQRMVMPNVSDIENAERELEETLRRKGRAANRGNDLWELDGDIDTIEMRLDIYRAMLEIEDLPFTMYVQLMMIPDGGPPKVQYLVYNNKTLQEVKDHFMLKLFGYNTPIHVKNMNVARGIVLNPDDLGSIVNFERGPEYFLKSPYFPLEISKLKVSNLSSDWDIPETLNAIRPVLDGSPLKIIKFDYSQILNNPDDPIIENCEFLNFTGDSPLEILRRISNKRIHLEECNFTQVDANNIVKHWRQSNIKIGSHHSIGFRDGDDVQKLLNSFRGMPGARSGDWEELRATTFPECVILPIGDHSEVNIYCETPKSQDAEYCDTQWIVRMKIQDKGFADNLFID